jgi:hypothetical protein
MEGGYYRLENPNHTNPANRPSSFKRGNTDYESIIRDIQKKTVIEEFHETLKDNLIFVERILKYTPAIVYFIENNTSVKLLELLNDEENLYQITLLQNYKTISQTNFKKARISSDISILDNIQKKKLFDLMNVSIFIHFEFPNNEHWYQFYNDLNLITKKMFSEFIDDSENGIVFKKAFYKTLCSGDKKNDIQFPSFNVNNKHKSKSFHDDELQDLFYAVDYTNKGRQIVGTDFKLIVLPKGKYLTAKDYDTFLSKKDEERIVNANQNDAQKTSDILFDFSSDNNENITSFDLIFCKKGGQSSPDKDLIEISGIEKSKLRAIMERINHVAYNIDTERKGFLKTEKELFPLKIDYSFKCILGNPQNDIKTGKVSYKPNPKYQSHLLRVLPLIYTENYFYDDILLPAFLQNVEFSIRSGDSRYSFLKYDLKFLLSIQNSKNNRFMEITTSESYQIGYLLGELAKNLSLEINSFEKNYVGNLTRRIGNLSDFIKLKNEIEQKLIMHEKTKFTFQKSYNLAQKVKEFNERYDKEECAFGFMEAYFKPLLKKDGTTNN